MEHRSRMARLTVAAAVPLAAFTGMIALDAALARGALPALPLTGLAELDRIVTLQALVLPVALAVLFWPRAGGAGRRFRRWGDPGRGAGAVRWLGIAQGQPWRSVVASFLPIVTLVTGGVLAAQAGGLSALSAPLWAVAFILGLAASNALAEETFARFHVVAVLHGHVPPRVICLASAAVFGLPHALGTPGGPGGVVLAGFLGWLLAKAVIETRGLGLAWLVHAVQDVVIYAAILPA